MNQSAKYYVGVVAVGGLIGLAYGAMSVPWGANAFLLLALVLLCGLAQMANVPLFTNSSVSVAFAIAFVALLIIGPGAAVLANLGAAVVHSVYPKRRAWYKVIFNTSVFAISAALSGATYNLAGGVSPTRDLTSAVGPALLAAIVYFLVNTSTVALAVSLTTGNSFLKVFNENHRWLALHYVVIAAFSLVVIVGYQTMGLAGLLGFALLFAVPWIFTRMYVAQVKLAMARTAEVLQMKAEIERLANSGS